MISNTKGKEKTEPDISFTEETYRRLAGLVDVWSGAEDTSGIEVIEYPEGTIEVEFLDGNLSVSEKNIIFEMYGEIWGYKTSLLTIIEESDSPKDRRAVIGKYKLRQYFKDGGFQDYAPTIENPSSGKETNMLPKDHTEHTIQTIQSLISQLEERV